MTVVACAVLMSPAQGSHLVSVPSLVSWLPVLGSQAGRKAGHEGLCVTQCTVFAWHLQLKMGRAPGRGVSQQVCPWETRCLPEEVLVSLGARALTRRWGSQYQSLVPLAQGLLPSILQALESELVLGPSSWWVCSTDTCVSHGEGVLRGLGVWGSAELSSSGSQPHRRRQHSAWEGPQLALASCLPGTWAAGRTSLSYSR